MTTCIKINPNHAKNHMAVVKPVVILSVVVNAFPVQFSLKNKYWDVLLYVVIFYICISSTRTAPAAQDSTSSECFQCMTLMNRAWKENVDKCSGTKNDCGKCINGYSGTEKEKCEIKSDAIEITASGTAFVPDGANVILGCNFSETVDCAWSRRGFHLNVGGRYSFISGQNGMQTNDCSIKIKEFNQVDVGDWDCKSMADSTHTALTSTAVKLFNGIVFYCNLKNHDAKTSDKVIFEGMNKNAWTPLEETAVLKCRFNTSIDCSWSRSGHFVVINGRYQYLNAKNGLQTDDCSIRIKAVQEIDIAKWDCNTLGDSSQSAIQSASITLLKVTAPSVLKRPQNASVTDGDKVELSCTFNAEVECQWQHNNNEADSTQFKFKEDKSHFKRDCSIEILSSSTEHAGAWTCNYIGSSNSSNMRNTVWITTDFKEKSNPIPTTTDGTIIYNSSESIGDSPENVSNDSTSPERKKESDFDWIIIIVCVIIGIIAIAIIIFLLFRFRACKCLHKPANSSKHGTDTDSKFNKSLPEQTDNLLSEKQNSNADKK